MPSMQPKDIFVRRASMGMRTIEHAQSLSARALTEEKAKVDPFDQLCNSIRGGNVRYGMGVWNVVGYPKHIKARRELQTLVSGNIAPPSRAKSRRARSSSGPTPRARRTRAESFRERVFVFARARRRSRVDILEYAVYI